MVGEFESLRRELEWLHELTKLFLFALAPLHSLCLVSCGTVGAIPAPLTPPYSFIVNVLDLQAKTAALSMAALEAEVDCDEGKDYEGD